MALTPISTTQLSATGAAGYTAAAPGNAQAALLSARTGAGYLTLDGSTPGAATGHSFQPALAPVQVPVASRGVVSWVSVSGATAASGAAVLDITWLGV